MAYTSTNGAPVERLKNLSGRGGIGVPDGPNDATSICVPSSEIHDTFPATIPLAAAKMLRLLRWVGTALATR